MSTESINPTWYYAKSEAKHVSQVVIMLPPQAEVPPRVGSLVGGGAFMIANWAVTALFMPGDTPEAKGPFVFARASGVVEMLKRRPAIVAFAFYRLRMGGVFQVFVQVDSPEVRAKAGYPFLAEHARWLDEDEDRRLVEALINRERLEACFVAPDKYGPCTGYFGLAVNLPTDCREALKREWDDLLTYHKGLTKRDFEAALDQYNRENPMQETPILEEPSSEQPNPKSTVAECKPSEPTMKKKWWRFWK